MIGCAEISVWGAAVGSSFAVICQLCVEPNLENQLLYSVKALMADIALVSLNITADFYRGDKMPWSIVLMI